MNISRRLLVGAGAASLIIPTIAFGATTSKRLVVIILRGGMDGLAAAPPVGDPAYANARGVLAQEKAKTLSLNSTFALHPRFENLHAMYRAGEAALVHATCTPYRERSHFDAQNVLETGGVRPYARNAGWLNAALKALPAERAAGRRELGLAVAQQAPLILRGDAAVSTWSPSPLPDADNDTVARLMDLYGKRDPGLQTALQSAIAANGVVMADGPGGMGGRGGARAIAPLTKAAAQFLKVPTGPVAAVVEMGGWDTHANQGAETGQLAANFALLDQGLGALKTDLGSTWNDTVVVVMTEFGRTVAPNGNRGADHGTASAAFLLGGAVRGGRVISDWPGLAQNQLNEGRDLRATTDLRGVLKGVLRDHLGVSDANAFPDSAAIRPMEGLLKA